MSLRFELEESRMSVCSVDVKTSRKSRRRDRGFPHRETDNMDKRKEHGRDSLHKAPPKAP